MLRERIVWTRGHERFPLLAVAHGGLLSRSELDGLDPGIGKRHVLLLECPSLGLVGDDRTAVGSLRGRGKKKECPCLLHGKELRLYNLLHESSNAAVERCV